MPPRPYGKGGTITAGTSRSTRGYYAPERDEIFRSGNNLIMRRVRGQYWVPSARVVIVRRVSLKAAHELACNLDQLAEISLMEATRLRECLVTAKFEARA